MLFGQLLPGPTPAAAQAADPVPTPAPTVEAAASPCALPITNPVACENTRTGNPSSEWDLRNIDSSQIEGYATDISVDQGQTVRFKVNTTATAYRIDVYRLGYYGGLGGRKVATIPNTATVKQRQPSCLSDPSTGLVDCGNWALSASWAVPSDAVSGLYVAKLVREDGPAGANHIHFVVRDDDGRSDVLFQSSDTTWQAYNDYGGNSLYVNQAGNLPAGRAYKVSYNRPFATRLSFASRSFAFANEYPMIRWLESNGYNVSYSSGVDTDRRGAELLEHRAFLSVGHDEYWSGPQRANVEAARAAGVHLAFFSGNEAFWKTRWENSIDGSGTAYRTLVSYKETQANAKIDPSPTWTGSWRDPRFSPPSDGGRPENGLTGTIFTVQAYTSPPLSEADRSMAVPSADGKMRFWRNTSVANQATGQSTAVGPSTLGFEWDEDLDNGARPAGLIRLSTRTLGVQEKILDFGSTVGPGTATHSMTLYRDPTSRALVFGAGTIQYAWGLDPSGDNDTSPVDPRLQQATVNLLADMGLQPATLQPGLVAATASTDATAPTSTITSPSPGADLPSGTPVTITGTASDVGGQVGGVEVSIDDGATWHRANGRGTWSYTGMPMTVGEVTFKSRAVDDSGNLEKPSAGVTVKVHLRDCPCSVWNDAVQPAVASVASTAAIELGVKFRADRDGWITGLRFYKGPNNTGTHVGRLWSSAGQLLASATFAAETSTGWQQVTLATPVAVTANTTYVASYQAPNGGYAYDSFGLAMAPVQNAPLTVLRDGEQGGNGVFSGNAFGFPTASYQATNYWVDVVFSTTPPPDTTPPYLTGRTPSAGATDAGLTSVTALFSEPVTAASISFVLRNGAGAVVPSSFVYDGATRTATLTPSSPLALGASYSATVGGAADPTGNVMAPDSWSFSTPTCPCSLWSDTTTPPFNAYVNGQPLELGVRLRSDVAGYLTAVRFYKTAGDPGVHRTSLWRADGTLLATATASGETASGWQQVTLSPPVPVAANTTYVASYHSSAGRYAASQGYFAGSSRRYGPLRARSDGEDGPNGAYREGPGGFPTGGSGGNNYLVDVAFSTTPPPDGTPPTVVGRSPLPDTVGASQAPSVRATFSESVVPKSISFTLRTSHGIAVPAALSYDDASRTATLTPSAPLGSGATYTATVSAADLAGNEMKEPDAWSFTTQACPCSIWTDTTAPSLPSVGPSGPLELGVKFRSDVAGYVWGIRFYKGGANGGTHVGHLWSGAGALLATATFENESASGWQQVNFASPVLIGANTTYVASYLAPGGGYAYDGNYFATGITHGSLRALANADEGGNGVFREGGGFPNASYNAANYWVDVAFATTPPPDSRPPTVIDRQPAPGASNAPPRPAVRATFDEPIDPSSLVFELRNSGGQLVPSAVVYDDAARRATLTPNAPLASGAGFTASVRARDTAGNLMPAADSWSFSTLNCPCSFWSDAAVPTYGATNPTPLELGVRVESEVDGYVTALRFYKDAANTGTHVAHLWSASGALLASATFKDETAQGWQQVALDPAVPVTASAGYVVSYSSPTGRYSFEPAYFAAGYQSGPLRAPSSGGNNGVYGAAGSPPTNSYNSTNYWVDLVFSTAPPADTTPPTTIARAPSPGSTDASTSPSVRATFSEPIVSGSLSFVLRTAGGALVPSTVSYDDASRTATLRPNAALASGAGYSATVSATDLTGNAMTAPESWSFTTATCPCTIWAASATPSTASVGPSGPLELGVKFRSDVAGRVTGLRFYKGSGNTGTHVAHLWSAGGALLATATFAGESASGWQQVSFATPVNITADTTHVASYTAPNGGYAYDGAYFGAAVSRGPLTALASGVDGGNGVYHEGAGGFPTDSYNAANYWVDVVFSTGP